MMKKRILGDFQAQGRTSNTHCHSSGSTQGERETESREKRRRSTPPTTGLNRRSAASSLLLLPLSGKLHLRCECMRAKEREKGRGKHIILDKIIRGKQEEGSRADPSPASPQAAVSRLALDCATIGQSTTRLPDQSCFLFRGL